MFGVDRQAMVMSIAIPVIIASILGWLDSTASNASPATKIPIVIVDEDRSTVTANMVAKLTAGGTVSPETLGRDSALKAVREGSVCLAAVIPKGFGQRTANLFSGGPKPELTVYEDPAKALNVQIAAGTIQQAAATAAAKATFGALADMGSPVTVHEQPVGTINKGWAQAAHDYAGFGLQGLLFFAVESAVALGRERRQGIWKRLRSAPVRPNLFLLAKGISSFVLALAIILLIFMVGALLFHIQAQGTVAGFAAVAVASALMTATFGLVVATIGKTETQSRAISILLILVMLATGGAWFPMDRMPAWVQTAANFMPVRWAVEGFDAATWRGLDFVATLGYTLRLLGFAAVFALLAGAGFRTRRGAD
jgi:ABC-2 type transport system permease protein